MGLPSQRRRNPYSIDSISRALEHHSISGAVREWHAPTPAQSKWRVRLNGLDEEQLNTAQMYALCLGLAAAGERAAKADEVAEEWEGEPLELQRIERRPLEVLSPDGEPV